MGFKLFLEAEKQEKPKEYSPTELASRQRKKRKAIRTLAGKVRSLKTKLKSDLNSEDEKTKLTALVLMIMLETSERVGNEESASNGHYGITGLRKKHLKFSNGNATLSYTGKSGVDQEKTIRNNNAVSLLKKYVNKNDGYIFTTEEGFKVKAAQVNRYLKDFDISAKDIRGHGANHRMMKKMNMSEIPKEESDRKKKFLEMLADVADQVGHTKSMLRNSYLMPEVEENYIKKGKITKIEEI